MRNFWLPKAFQQIHRVRLVELSPQERDRLRALTLWAETSDVQLAARTFGLSRATLSRWRQRFHSQDLTSLHNRSRRPHRVRQPTWSPELLQAVKTLREQYPRWGRDKLAIMLQQQGMVTSASTVGRILTDLKCRGLRVEPLGARISTKKRRPKRPYAIRKPREYTAEQPGDIVQVDTLDIRPLPGIILKQCTARDAISRWDVLEVRSRATATTAAQFLTTLEARMPFPVRALQVDGGSEFHRDFEAQCQARGIQLFVLPPQSPKLNGAVERAQRTHTEEFYEGADCSWRVAELSAELLHWERTYNCVRPHQALAYRTPLQYLKDHAMIPADHNPYENLSHMS